MISKAEIESLAAQIADPNFDSVAIEPLIGHLPDRDYDAVLERAEEIERGCGEGRLAQARAEESLLRLARAAGWRGDRWQDAIPWLAERGLVEKTPKGNGWSWKAIKPPSAVG